jgi:hypothetical protein
MPFQIRITLHTAPTTAALHDLHSSTHFDSIFVLNNNRNNKLGAIQNKNRQTPLGIYVGKR